MNFLNEIFKADEALPSLGPEEWAVDFIASLVGDSGVVERGCLNRGDVAKNVNKLCISAELIRFIELLGRATAA